MSAQPRKIKYKLPMLFYVAAFICLLAAAIFTLTLEAEKDLTIIYDVSASMMRENIIPAEYINYLNPDSARTINTGSYAYLSSTYHDGEWTPIIFDMLENNLREQTNLAEGIELAAKRQNNNYARRRIILFTDGNETEGNAIKAIKKTGLQLDVIPCGRQPVPDAQVNWLRLPPEIRPAEEFNAEGLFMATPESEVYITIVNAKGTVLTKQRATIPPTGKKLTFTLKADSTGLQTFTARVRLQGDTVEQNNFSTAATLCKSNRTIIWCGAVGPALLGFKKVEILPDELNRNLLSQFSLLVLNNLSSQALEQKTFILEDFMKNGGRLMIIGGSDSLGAGGWINTQLETLAPVSLIPDKNLAVIFALDSSGSMGDKNGQRSKFDLAQEAIKATVNTLAPNDEYSIITFDTSARITVPLTNKSKQQQLQYNINEIPQGGTSIFSAIKAGIKILANNQSTSRSIILVTDGQTREKDKELATELNSARTTLQQNKISLSVITIGRDPQDNMLRELCKGYGTVSSADENLITLPVLLRDEVHTSRKGFILKNRSLITPNDQKISIASTAAVGQLKNDNRGKILLRSTEGDIIAAEGRYGLGYCLLVGSPPWLDWTPASASNLLYENLVTRFAQRSMPNLYCYSEGNNVYVAWKPKNIASGPWQAQISAPESPVMTVSLSPQSGGIWTGTLLSQKLGLNTITVSSNFNSAATSSEVIAQNVVFINNQEEYLRFGANGTALAAMSKAGNGAMALTPNNLTPWEQITPSGNVPTGSFYLSLLSLLLIIIGLTLKGISS